MKRDKGRYRQELRRVEASRAVYLEKILGERGPLRRGSFVTLRRKCGKPNCRCAAGEGHPAQYLSVKEGGRTRLVYVSGAQADRVAEEARRYRRFRQARATLAKLGRRSLAAIDGLGQAMETTEGLPGRKGEGGRPRRKPPRKKG
ncbi:MAG: DUF6788 family protein [Candidatus Acidoferrales bacterium]